jgi:hypothetical protein
VVVGAASVVVGATVVLVLVLVVTSVEGVARVVVDGSAFGSSEQPERRATKQSPARQR